MIIAGHDGARNPRMGNSGLCTIPSGIIMQYPRKRFRAPKREGAGDTKSDSRAGPR
jgi:hypothetical protein